MIVFSDQVLRAARSIKTSEARFKAFDSPAFPRLADITATGIHFSHLANRTDLNAELILKPHFERGIFSVELVPGIEPAIVRATLRSGTCKGLLLKSLGAGNVPTLDEYSLIPVIEEAARLAIPVMISTKFIGGNTHMDIYEPGMLALQAGAIPTGDLTDVAAQVKFMWALAQGHHHADSLREVIFTDFVGEISSQP
jgi:L-asparaginase